MCNLRSRGDMHIICDFDVPGNANLSGERTTLANACAAGDTDTGRHCAILTNVHVCAIWMRLLKLYTALDYRVLECAAINRRVCTNLHIITDNHPSQLRGFFPTRTISRIAETVTANHRAGVDNAVLAQHAVSANGHLGMQPCPKITDHGASADVTAGANHRATPYTCTGFNHRLRSDRYSAATLAEASTTALTLGIRLVAAQVGAAWLQHA